MNPFISRILLLCFIGLGLTMPSVAAPPEPVFARVWLTSGAIQDVRVLPGREQKTLRVEVTNMIGQVEFNYSDIEQVAFQVQEPVQRIRTHFQEGQYKEAAEIAQAVLAPLLPYLELKNNIDEDVLLMLEAQFHAGTYPELLRSAEKLQTSWTDEKELRLLRVYQLLGQALEEDEISLLVPLEKMEEPDVDDAYFAPYWFGRGLLGKDRKQWVPALEGFSKILVLQPRNHVWVPRTLYQTALLYWKLRKEASVDSITAQMELSYPDHEATQMILRLKEEYPNPLLVNSSFETAIDSGQGWQTEPAGALQIARERDQRLHDNGLIPDGSNAVAVIVTTTQPPVTLYQDVQGFQPGQTYFLTGYQSANAAQGGDSAGPFLEIRIDDQVIEKRHLVKPVQGEGRYSREFRRMVSDAFTATASVHRLSFDILPGFSDDPAPRTLLLDHLTLLDLDVERIHYTPNEP